MRSRSRSKSRSRSRSRSRYHVSPPRHPRAYHGTHASRSLSPSTKGHHRIGGFTLHVQCGRGKVYNPGSDRCVKTSSKTGKAIMKKMQCFEKAKKLYAKCGKGVGKNFI